MRKLTTQEIFNLKINDVMLYKSKNGYEKVFVEAINIYINSKYAVRLTFSNNSSCVFPYDSVQLFEYSSLTKYEFINQPINNNHKSLINI